MDWQSWSHHGFVSGTVLYTCGLDSVHKTLMRRRLAWKTQFEEDATEPRLQHWQIWEATRADLRINLINTNQPSTPYSGVGEIGNHSPYLVWMESDLKLFEDKPRPPEQWPFSPVPRSPHAACCAAYISHVSESEGVSARRLEGGRLGAHTLASWRGSPGDTCVLFAAIAKGVHHGPCRSPPASGPLP